ncbi:hypothetical protein Pan44_43340 [Caulifigura coniformis]|uniref:Uncharacterized protein n=1 Tax=Caulifigura coniformis TaxID=2527983 RepID=A0A517SJH4_9PLAN|nr:hypothetical protein [Caulifigura coniformis]QDT56281.1 hypothetical protein Pan44_43340 [Caulifigura coniformis]
MMQPNWFDQSFDESYGQMCGTATLEEKVDAALQIITTNPRIRKLVQRVIAQQEENDGRGICGASLSQSLRGELATVLNEDPN